MSETAVYRIEGMDCAEEIAPLRAAFRDVAGVHNLAFDVLNGKLTVYYDPATTGPAAFVAAVATTGMRAIPATDAAPNQDQESLWRRRRRPFLTVASGACTAIGFVLELLGRTPGSETQLGLTAARCFYAAAIVCGTWLVLPKAWSALKNFRPDMNLLMVVAVLGAVAIGEWSEAATVAFLFALSLLLESWSVGRARRAIAALMDLAPPMARIRNDQGQVIEVDPQSVAVGAHFVVRPGERFPLDGRVMAGQSHVDQAPITGESMPVPKQSGDEVFAGTINGDGALDVASTKPARDTTLANMIRLVGVAQTQRAPSEQWVERFARIYTPAVMTLALAVLLLPPLVFDQAWSTWVYNALVLLVIACPCALVISTPVSIVAALTAAARRGILIKGGVFVETPARIRALALDKTGTITEGKPSVTEVAPLARHNEQDLLERAAALEARSDHPLAKAIVAYADQQGIAYQPAEQFQIIKGKGATGRLGGREYWLGSHRYLEERGQEDSAVHERLEALSHAGRSVVVIGNAEHVCGFIALADRVRPHIRDTLAAIRAAGIGHIIMLTGDNAGTAAAVAKEAGIDDVRAELLPEEKVTAIEELVGKYHAVAMVGDGVNDAPALARATLGIAMGVAGSDVAIETADIALMADDLSNLPWLIQHSRRTLTIIRQNVLFSLSVKALFVGLTVAGASSLWGAIAADTGASLLVVFNGLRLLNAGRASSEEA
jgi:Cd2+/Zn2+-exporting ATPase